MDTHVLVVIPRYKLVQINLKEFLQEQKLHSKRETWAKYNYLSPSSY